jgi:hypothetical protein
MYRDMQRSGQSAAPSASRSGPLSHGEILEIVRDSERPASPGAEAAPTPAKSGQAAMADGVVSFLKYMVSPRWTNLQAYLNTFTTGRGAIGIDAVLGVLVDFDYWLDCPPRSTQDDQVKLHQRLYDLYAKSSPLGGAYFHPVVAYNPWTDIEQDGEALRRVIDACTNRHFIAAKIYPPTGFQPAGNAAIAEGKLTKRHPSTKDLDTRLENFFNACADKNIPVLAHAAPSNGRDDFHDGFSGPTEWETLLAQQAAKARVPRVDLGHFGGGRRNWTQEFACLISRFPTMSLYGDLGYWDELMCGSREPEVCETARHQLEEAMKIAIPGTADTVLDRVMFATDWLMLSQVRGWADYPRRVRDQLRQIPGMGDAELAKVLGGNALKCFPGLRPSRSEEVGDGE